jgi:replicative DNA helicase
MEGNNAKNSKSQGLKDLPLPCNAVGEAGLLCSIIQNTAIYLEHEDQIGEHLFQSPANKKIFAVLRDLCPSCAEIDFQAIIGELTRKGQLKEVGDKEAVNEVYGFIPTSAAWRTYYEQAFEAHRLRQMKLTACQIWESPDLETAHQAAEALTEISGRNVKPVIPFKERLHDVLDYIKQLSTTTSESVVRFGIEPLDYALQPIEPGNQVVICSETGGGKTALAGQAILCSSSKSFAIFSLEMGARSLVLRMLAAESAIPLGNLRRGRLTVHERPRLPAAMDRLAKRTVYLEDEHPIDVRGIAARCRTLKRQRGGLDAVVVDYLQLVAPSATGKRDLSREREVAEISRGLKSLALELQIVVVALSQLNEAGQLRESRAIGQDADVVLHILPGESGAASIQIRKHRNGPRGAFLVNFDGSTLRFSAPEKKAAAPRDPSCSELYGNREETF